MNGGDRRTNSGANYSGIERRNRGSGGPNDDINTEEYGVPSVARRKGKNKVVNILGIIAILIAGLALILAVNGDKNKGPKKKKEAPDTIANNLPPLIIPATPVRINTPVVTPTTNAKPIAVNSTPGPAVKPLPTWQDRKMGGLALVSGSSNASGVPGAAAAQQTQQPDADVGPQSPTTQGGKSVPSGELAAKLEPTVMAGSMAGLLQDRNYVVAKGTMLDCALETALDSTVPGLTTCRLTRDVYSDNGQVVLLDRGTQLVGEYQGGIKHGQARLFVLWSRAKTPNGVIVTLNSPGTDALGRSGLEGWVDNHFIDRFGAAIMISLLKDTYALLIARQSGGGGGQNNTLVLGNTVQGTDKMAEKALEASVNIPPTLMKNQGDHIQVFLARDLDFSRVYALRSGK